MEKRALILGTVLYLLALTTGAALAQPPTVAVRPFEVYSAPELQSLAPGLQAALASRLAGEGYRVVTPRSAEPGDEAWAVRTVITRLGAIYSVDAALEPVAASGESARAYQTAKSAEDVLVSLEAVAAKLKEFLARALTAAPRQQPPASAAPAAPQPAAAAPPVERASPLPVPEPPTPVPQPPPLPAAPAPRAPAAESPQPADTDLRQILEKRRMGAPIEGEAKSLVVTDVNGDGSAEILLLIGAEIAAYRDQGETFSLLWKTAAPKTMDPVLLSAGDIDNDGRPELFVAGMQRTTPTSQAYRWSGSGLVPQGDLISGFVRAVAHPELGSVLIGALPGGGKDLFAYGIRTFRWADGQYRPADRLKAPEVAGLNIDWCRLEAGKPPFALVTTQTELFRVYNPEGKRVFESDGDVKGTRAVLVGEERAPNSMDADWVRIEGKTLCWPAGHGTNYVVLFKNYSPVGRLLQRVTAFSQGQVLIRRWDGITLLPVAEGPKTPGFFADVDIALSPAGPESKQGGGATLYAPLVQSEGVLSSRYTSRIMAYDLPTLARP